MGHYTLDSATHVLASATDHLCYFPKLDCPEPCCRQTPVYDNPRVMRSLMELQNWWNGSFIGGFATFMAQTSGHRDIVHVLFRWFNITEVWAMGNVKLG